MSSSNKFVLKIVTHDSMRHFRDFELKIQNVFMPTLSLPQAPAHHSPYHYAGITPGSAIEFGPLQVTVISDENLETYRLIYEWMYSFVPRDYRPEEVIPDLDDTETFLFNGILFINSPTSGESIKKMFHFRKMWPSSVGNLQFSTTNDNHITFDVTLQAADFTFYEPNQLGK